jgi:hypothetical protein
VIIFSGFLTIFRPSIFRKYLGNLNPLLLFIAIAIIGLVSLIYLVHHYQFQIITTGNHKRVFLSYTLALLLAVLIIVFIDIRGGFPKDINVKLPEGALFYPTIGFLVEIVFHVLPLTLILIIGSFLNVDIHHENSILIILIISALFEPIYQTIIGDRTPWVTFYQFAHIFIINLIQLKLFQSYDFVSMFSFRLVYYLFWHIVWGYLRLIIIF